MNNLDSSGAWARHALTLSVSIGTFVGMTWFAVVPHVREEARDVAIQTMAGHATDGDVRRLEEKIADMRAEILELRREIATIRFTEQRRKLYPGGKGAGGG